MKRTDTLIIGGGQAGLAMSRCLSDRGVDHVVLERGRVAERWRSERWDSLRLLTPNWQTRLPGFSYQGPDPDGYMGMPELVGFFDRYAAAIAAPVQTGTTVLGVEQAPNGFEVQTDAGAWRAPNVVVATGYSDVPHVPAAASRLSSRILQLAPSRYRNPEQLPPGGALIVGASATGVQLAEEIHASGRPVTLAVGAHLRMPRTYRGRDILWWLDAMGIFEDTVESVFNASVSRSQPSLQLVGRDDRRSLDVAALQRQGVRLVGRVVAADHEEVACDDDIIATTVASDVKLAGLLSRVDEFIRRNGLEQVVDEPAPFEPTWPAAFDVVPETVNLRSAGIATVIWATGFRRAYPWLKLPVFDEAGEIRHRGGITPIPGLYVLGMHFQRRRNSAFIDGVGADAEFLAERIVCLAARETAAAGAWRTQPWPATQRI